MQKTILWLTAFSIAMGFLESAVVVYLREIMYPEGFDFPLAVFPENLILTEVLRETATLIMLAAVGFFTGRNNTERFGFFLFSFAIWDIFYYVFLYLLLGWPESLMTWDILFLIPTTWVGPVITPVLISMVMIAFALFISKASDKTRYVYISRTEWYLLIIGSLVLIYNFCLDYGKFVIDNFGFKNLFNSSETMVYQITRQYVPSSFNWWLFTAGMCMISFPVWHFARRFRNSLPRK